MFIKLRDNSSDILSVNINAYKTIAILQRQGEFVLALANDSSTFIDVYPTRERALQAFENIMDKLANGVRVCYSSDL